MKKSLHEAINAIYNTKWTLNNNFFIEFIPFPSNTLWNKLGLDNIDFNLYLKSFTLPQYGSSTIIEDWINDRYRIAQGAYDVAKFELSFKDYDGFFLYKKFLNYLTESKNKYFNDIAFNIDVYKLPDYPDEKSTKIMTIEKCSISYVSSISLSNENEAQIGEFNIQIKSATIPEITFNLL